MIVAALTGLVLASACRQLNESHCGNQNNDATCQQRDMATPFCNLCVAVNDGCVAEASLEPGCGGGSTSVAVEATSSNTAPADSSTGETTDAVDSSSGSGGINLCGNGVIDEEAGEACDGAALPPDASCMAARFGEGEVGCTEDCSTVDYTDCKAYSECGNNEVANGEVCDSENLNGHTCDELPNLMGGGLACDAECELDPSACLACVEKGEECTSGQSVCCDEGDICSTGLFSGTRCCTPGPVLGSCVL